MIGVTGLQQRPSCGFLRPVCERVAAAIALVLVSPLLLAAGVWILIESGRPIFFRQQRIGRGGRSFTLLKLRSMRTDVAGSRITAGADPRITRAGAFLRKHKLDELPQLWNVLRGDMQFVGPRPELPSLVNPADPVWRAVLEHKPGITDLPSLVYRDEDEILGLYEDPDRAYREHLLPDKLRLSIEYMSRRRLTTDCRLILLTFRYGFFPFGFSPERVRKLFAGG